MKKWIAWALAIAAVFPILYFSNIYYEARTICADCSKRVLTEETEWVNDEKTVCKNCLYKIYDTCENCREWFEIDDLKEYLCYPCYEKKPTSECQICFKMFRENELDGGICSSCLDEFYESIEGKEPCSNCGAYCWPDELVESIHLDGNLCQECTEEGYTCEICGLYENSCGDDDYDNSICCNCIELH